MPAKRVNVCLKCRWWISADSISHSGEQLGYCHFYAPRRHSGRYSEGSAFPLTLETDWCSQFVDGRSYATAYDDEV